jgi:hypothetical protein
MFDPKATKLTMLPHKPEVMVGWTLDLFFSRDIEQMITLRDVEALGDLAGRIRACQAQLPAIAPSSPHESATRAPLK